MAMQRLAFAMLFPSALGLHFQAFYGPGRLTENTNSGDAVPWPVDDFLQHCMSHGVHSTIVNAVFDPFGPKGPGAVGSLVKSRAHATGQAELYASGNDAYDVDHAFELRALTPAAQWVLLFHASAPPGKEIRVLEGARTLLTNGTVTYLLLHLQGTRERNLQNDQVAAGSYLMDLGYHVLLLAAEVADGMGVDDFRRGFLPNQAFNPKSLDTFVQALAHFDGSAYLFATMGRDLAIPSLSEFVVDHPEANDEFEPFDNLLKSSSTCNHGVDHTGLVRGGHGGVTVWDSRTGFLDRSSIDGLTNMTPSPVESDWTYAGRILDDLPSGAEAVCIYSRDQVASRICRTRFGLRPREEFVSVCGRSTTRWRYDEGQLISGGKCLTLPGDIKPNFKVEKERNIGLILEACNGNEGQQWYIDGNEARSVIWHGRVRWAPVHPTYIAQPIGSADTPLPCELQRAATVPDPATGHRKHFVEPKRDGKRNIVVLLLDAVSRPHLFRMLPRTVSLLQQHAVDFTKYAVVGPNSGPNQAALYAGADLVSRNLNNVKQQWFWDRLREAGYETMKLEDDCVRNSNVIRSLRPNTTYGSEHDELQCLLGDPAEHSWCNGVQTKIGITLRYASQFIKSTHDTPFAAMVHLLPGHENSGFYLHTVDGILSQFLAETIDQHVQLVVLSDHGLHYGPFESTPPGRKEHAQPFLFVHTPVEQEREELKMNQHQLTTPFDVHRTLLGWADLQPADECEHHGCLRHRLDDPELRMAEKRTCASVGIPTEWCLEATVTEKDAGKPFSARRHPTCTAPFQSISMNSFYAPTQKNYNFRRSHVQPDIVVLVVDSLSRDHARRMLPSFQKELAQQFGGVVFQSHSVTGWKSIENEHALFRGCYAFPSHAVSDLLASAPANISLKQVSGANTHRKYETWCTTADTNRRGSPWLFEALRKEGYQTMHASQICTRKSAYSTEVFYQEDKAWDQRYDACGREAAEGKKHLTLPAVDVLASVSDFIHAPERAGPRYVQAELVIRHEYIRSKDEYHNDGHVNNNEKDLLALAESLLRHTVRPLMLVMLGDHGLAQGLSSREWAHQVEYRNPFMAMAWSDGLMTEDNAELLKKNALRLTTHFDLYETLIRVSHADVTDIPWATSLFEKEVPADRTCREAGIPKDFCLCSEDNEDGEQKCDHPLAPRLRHCTWWSDPLERCCKTF